MAANSLSCRRCCADSSGNMQEADIGAAPARMLRWNSLILGR